MQTKKVGLQEVPEADETYFFIVTLTNEHGVIVSDENGLIRHLVTKKWERVQDLIEGWETTYMREGWAAVVHEVRAFDTTIYTK